MDDQTWCWRTCPGLDEATQTTVADRTARLSTSTPSSSASSQIVKKCNGPRRTLERLGSICDEAERAGLISVASHRNSRVALKTTFWTSSGGHSGNDGRAIREQGFVACPCQERTDLQRNTDPR